MPPSVVLCFRLCSGGKIQSRRCREVAVSGGLTVLFYFCIFQESEGLLKANEEDRAPTPRLVCACRRSPEKRRKISPVMQANRLSFVHNFLFNNTWFVTGQIRVLTEQKFLGPCQHAWPLSKNRALRVEKSMPLTALQNHQRVHHAQREL